MITRQAQWQVKPRPTRTGRVGRGQARPRSLAQNAAYAEGLRAIAANELSRFNCCSASLYIPGLPTGIFKCQITQIWHFSKAFGSEKLALAVWHIFGIILTTLAVKFLD